MKGGSDLLRLRLKELYEAKGVMQKDVHEATGIRQGTLSGLANNMRTSWDVEILDKLAAYFEIEDIRELIEYVSPKELNERFEKLYNEDKDR
jgi:transcriptional regulator with XRE-family HTH domain